MLQATQKLSVSVDSQTAEALLKFGNGKASAGVRAAVAMALELPDQPAPSDRLLREGRELALVDPKSVEVHRFHGRHASAFASAEYEALKATILHCGGNVIPALLFKDARGGLELIFGSRRWYAARELGLPLLAMIQEWGLDRDAARAMAVESRSGEIPWSVYERGIMLRRGLEAGLYPSKRLMAEHLGWSHSEVHRALLAAELPAELLAAFRTPSDIAENWVLPLASAWERDQAVVLEVAREFADGRRRGTPRTVFASLKESASRSP